MATAEQLERAIAKVRQQLGTEQSLRLPDDLRVAVLRVMDLWLPVARFVPGRLIPGSDDEWSDYDDLFEVGALTDVAVVRWTELRGAVAGVEGTVLGQIDDLLQGLVDLAIQVVSQLQDSYNALPQEFSDENSESRRLALLRLGDSAQIEHDRLTASQAAAEIKDARDAVRMNSGEIATADLAQHFEKYRASERAQAEVLRVVAGLIIVVTVFALSRLIPGDRTTAEVIQRGVFSIPLFAVATYLAAESARHRKAAQWAGTLRVQLLTVDLFTKPLDAAEAASVRMVLAKRAFGEVPMLAAGADQKEEAAMPVSLQAVLERLLVELRSKPDK